MRMPSLTKEVPRSRRRKKKWAVPGGTALGRCGGTGTPRGKRATRPGAAGRRLRDSALGLLLPDEGRRLVLLVVLLPGEVGRGEDVRGGGREEVLGPAEEA